jgi:hypothetical protein
MKTLSESDYKPDETRAVFTILEQVTKILTDCTEGSEGYCIIGGWVPYLVCGEHSSLGPHVGSMDVDVLLVPEQFRTKTDLGDALLKAGFEPEAGQLFPSRVNAQSAKWWAGKVTPKLKIRIDFMAPAPDRGQAFVESYAGGLKVLRFYGTQAAIHDPLHLEPGKPLAESVPIANGGAALLAKGIAYEARRNLTTSGKGSKDGYDLFYLITAYRKGVERLIEELLVNPEEKLREEVLRILESDFTNSAARGTQLVCDFVTIPPGGRNEFALQVSTQFTAFLRLVKEQAAER